MLIKQICKIYFFLVVCPKNTFSEDDDAYCKICPPGQYQPLPGSKSCNVCSSPVEDSMCLRMLVSFKDRQNKEDLKL